MELSQIYAPVNDDLKKVEQALLEVSRVDFPWLSELLKHSLGAGGKRIRPALTLMCGQFYNYRFENLLHMAVAIELMHTATLVHDDAIDKSDTRRGRATIYKLWGVDPAVLLGDYLFAKAGVESTLTNSLRAVRLFSGTLMIISSGELNQAKNSYNLHQTRQDYLNRIYGKTSSLFCLSTESGGILSQAPDRSVRLLRDYGYNLGMAFQIVDDILDFVGTEAELGKPAGSDLKQGTLTLPAMLLLERFPNDNPVFRLFNDHSRTENIPVAIEQIRNSSIVEECYKLAKEYCAAACQKIQNLPDKSVKTSLCELAEFVVKRRK
ncbi:MAG TPA: polyprenyl synthetase family protein [Dehalococcoidales bacterium]|nr:polyprenyl synthetase family protein [Dehalococcoidales bacterium]